MSLFGRLRAWLRRDSGAVALCRALEPAGWQHLHDADARGFGVVLVSAGDPILARRIAGLWLDVAVEARRDPEPALTALRAGRRVLVAGGTPADVATIAARLAAATGCAVIAMVVREHDRRVALALGPPLESVADRAEADVAQRIESRLEPGD